MSCVIHPDNISLISHKRIIKYDNGMLANDEGIVPVLDRKHLFICCVITLTHFLKHHQLLDFLINWFIY